MDIIENHNMLSPLQYGFRTGCGTNDAILDLVEDFYMARDKSQFVVTCYVDISKAFDCVNHSQLLTQLKQASFPKNIISWFKSYLEHRSQCTKVDGVTFTHKKVSFGVPQGSVLGPALFILF